MTGPAVQDDVVEQRFGKYNQFKSAVMRTNVGFDPKRYACKWETLHLSSTTYPESPSDEEKAKWQNYIAAFVDPGVGCGDCLPHLVDEVLVKFPIDYTSRHTFVWSCYEVHNAVRRRLKQCEMSPDEFVATYINSTRSSMKKLLNKDAYQKENDRNWWIFAFSAACAIILAAIYIKSAQSETSAYERHASHETSEQE
jgi:hypothetical protein